MSDANLELVRAAWSAWLRGDVDGLFAVFAPDVVLDTSHFRDWPEPSYHGIEGVRQFLDEWLETWDDYEVEIDQHLPASDDRVVTLLWHSGKGRESRIPVRIYMAQIATVRDGKVIRMENYDDGSEALQAAGLKQGSATG